MRVEQRVLICPILRLCSLTLLWYICYYAQINIAILSSTQVHMQKALETHSSTLAWKITWTEESGRLQSMGSLRVPHNWATSLSLFTFHFHALEKEMATHSSVLAWRIPGMGEHGGLLSMGSHRVGHDWRDLAAAASSQYIIQIVIVFF